jgi:DNA-binding NarL/FixJ family response regulator
MAAPIDRPLAVVLVDDHEIVRDGLAAQLTAAGMRIVGHAGDTASAVEVIRDVAPDVVVLDVRLPGGGGPEVLRRLAGAIPPTLAVSASDERDDVVATMRAGAAGYLLKSATTTEIVAAVRSVAAGSAVFSAELAGHLLDLDLGDHVEDPQWEALTGRQREVLQLLARGATYKEIAAELVVSVKTVETHVRHILHTLQVRDRHAASRWAHERGFSS